MLAFVCVPSFAQEGSRAWTGYRPRERIKARARTRAEIVATPLGGLVARARLSRPKDHSDVVDSGFGQPLDDPKRDVLPRLRSYPTVAYEHVVGEVLSKFVTTSEPKGIAEEVNVDIVKILRANR